MEILAAWQKNLNVEVILIFEFLNSEKRPLHHFFFFLKKWFLFLDSWICRCSTAESCEWSELVGAWGLGLALGPQKLLGFSWLNMHSPSFPGTFWLNFFWFLSVITFIALATSVLLWSSVLKLTKKFNSTSFNLKQEVFIRRDEEKTWRGWYI